MHGDCRPACARDHLPAESTGPAVLLRPARLICRRPVISYQVGNSMRCAEAVATSTRMGRHSVPALSARTIRPASLASDHLAPRRRLPAVAFAVVAALLGDRLLQISLTTRASAAGVVVAKSARGWPAPPSSPRPRSARPGTVRRPGAVTVSRYAKLSCGTTPTTFASTKPNSWPSTMRSASTRCRMIDGTERVIAIRGKSRRETPRMTRTLRRNAVGGSDVVSCPTKRIKLTPQPSLQLPY